MSRRSPLLLALATLLLAWPAGAMEFRSGDEVLIPADLTLNDDLYVAGGRIRIEGTINGDLVVAGGNVTVSGPVRDDLIVAGGDVALEGRVGQSVRAAGGMVTLSSDVGRDALVAGGTVMQAADSRVSGAGAFAGRTVTLMGTLGRDLKAAGQAVTLGGTLRGAQIVTEALTLGPRARLEGNLDYTAPATASLAPGAVVTGSTTYRPSEPDGPGFPAWNPWAFWLFAYFAALLSGLALFALLPRAADRIACTLEDNPLVAPLVGFGLLAATPAVVLALVITLLGIPLALVILATFLVMLHVGWLSAALTLGDLVVRRFKPLEPLRVRVLVSFMVGLLILINLQAIPWLGGLIGLLATVAGLGAAAMALKSALEGPVPPRDPESP